MKYIYILFFAFISLNIFAESSSETVSTQVKQLKDENKKLHEEVISIKSQLEKLNTYSDAATANKMILADVKKDMYESYVSNFNTILSIGGIISVVLAFFGFKNIQSRLDSHKQIIDENNSELREQLKDNKNLMLEFKKEIKEEYDKFEKRSTSQIKDGLDNELKNAIEKIMTGSIGEEIKNLSELVDTFEKRIAYLEGNSTNVINPQLINSTNAFEDDSE